MSTIWVAMTWCAPSACKPIFERHNSAMIDAARSPEPAPRKDSLIEFPCDFPIKVMGAHVAGFEEAMAHIALQFDPQFNRSTVERRESKGGKYLGLTLTLHATSQAQLDEIYRTLSSHPKVKVVL